MDCVNERGEFHVMDFSKKAPQRRQKVYKAHPGLDCMPNALEFLSWKRYWDLLERERELVKKWAKSLENEN